MGRSSCDDCRTAYAPTRWDTPAEREKKKNGPPCATCRPSVHPDNATAHAMYQRCSGQLIYAPMGGAVDINILAVKCVMDLKRITERDQDEILEQVQALAGVIIYERAKDAERRREDKERNR